MFNPKTDLNQARSGVVVTDLLRLRNRRRRLSKKLTKLQIPEGFVEIPETGMLFVEPSEKTIVFNLTDEQVLLVKELIGDAKLPPMPVKKPKVRWYHIYWNFFKNLFN